MIENEIQQCFLMLQQPMNNINPMYLKTLLMSIDRVWPQVAELKDNLINFGTKNPNFVEIEVVYAILSRMFYYTDELDKAFEYALKSPKFFHLFDQSAYSNALIDYILDNFISHTKKRYLSEKNDKVSLDPQIASLTKKILDLYISLRQYQTALGIAVDSSCPQFFEKCFTQCLLAAPTKSEKEAVASFAFEAIRSSALPSLSTVLITLVNYYCVRLKLMGPLNYAKHLMANKDMRTIAELLTALLVGLEVGPYLSHAQTGILKEIQQQTKVKASLKAEALGKVRDVNDELSSSYELLALQIAFDIAESADKKLIGALLSYFSVPYYVDNDQIGLGSSRVPILEYLQAEKLNLDVEKLQKGLFEVSKIIKLEKTLSSEELRDFARLFYSEHLVRSTLVRRVLVGRYTNYINLQFLYTNCSAGETTLGDILLEIGHKNAISSGGLVIAHAYSRCGTAQDGFFRRNGDWFGGLKNWTKFSAIASLGAVHKGNTRNTESILSTFLTQQAGQDSPYKRAGGLFALGLAHCENGAEKINFFCEALESSSDNEIIQHGACLGLGICSISLGSSKVSELLKRVLWQDNAISGEAAGIAIGLNGMGYPMDKLKDELIQIARNTEHEKIKRGVGLGLAFIAYEGQEFSKDIIDQLIDDENEILRYCGCFAIGMAYIGTSDSEQIGILLKKAVSDSSGDVRRAAVLSLTFVLCRKPGRIPGLVKLLAESFNPHSRYGAALAIGISMVGSGSNTALEILKPLLEDKERFVRGGAAIAISLVLSQCSTTQQPFLAEHWAAQFKRIRQSSLNDFNSFSKFSAIISVGLLTMGGGNSSVKMLTGQKMLRPIAAVGVMMFFQSWYWFPYYHFLSLAISPTAFIGVTSELKIPKRFKLFCPDVDSFLSPQIVFEKQEQKKQEETLKLSVTKNRKRRESKKLKKTTPLSKAQNQNSSKIGQNIQNLTRNNLNLIQNSQKINENLTQNSTKIDQNSPKIDQNPPKIDQNLLKIDEKSENSDKKPENGLQNVSKEIEREKEIENAVGRKNLLQNPTRVTARQELFVGEIEGQRYKTVRKGFGIVLLENSEAALEEDCIENKFIHEAQLSSS